jgi:hypothetical protein
MWHTNRSRLRLICAALILVASGCGGPTKPSEIASAPAASPVAPPPTPPAPAAPTGTLKFVSANPTPGSEVVLSSESDKGQSLAATFAVEFEAAIPGAVLEVQLLDATGQACASAVTEPQDVPAAQSVIFTFNSVMWKCTAPTTTETLKATLVTVSNATGPEPQRTEYLVASFPERYSFRAPAAPSPTPAPAPAPAPPAPPAPGPGSGISFVSSDPAPGGETSVTESGGVHLLGNMKMNFSVQYNIAIPDAKLQVQLLDGAGQVCWYTFVDYPIPANQPVTVPINKIYVWESVVCSTFPMRITTVKVMLLTLRGPEVNGRLQRTDYLTQSFPIGYTIQRYPAPPSVPPALPVIADLSWRVPLPTGGDPPISGDPVNIHCKATEADGAAVTLTLTLTWDGIAPKISTKAFPAGASSSPEGAVLDMGVSAPTVASGAPHATVSCVVTNTRGETASRSVEIGTRK